MSGRLLLLVALWASGCRTRLLDPGLEPDLVDARAPADAGASVDLGARPDGATAPCFGAMGTPWQFHDGPGPMCVDRHFPSHGAIEEYSLAVIPPANDPGWQAYAAPSIDLSRKSRLCGTSCSCSGVDFDYWQTFLTVPDGTTVTNLTFGIANVDDGARVTLFNSLFPDGVTDPGSYAFLGGGTISNLAGYLTPGANRIVVTHVDDCCSSSIISGTTLKVRGEFVASCQ